MSADLTEASLEDAIASILAEKNGKRLTLTPTHIDIRPAIEYWERNGYEPIGEVVDPAHMMALLPDHDFMYVAALNKFWMKRPCTA